MHVYDSVYNASEYFVVFQSVGITCLRNQLQFTVAVIT